MLEKQRRLEKHLDISNRRKEAMATLSLKARNKEGGYLTEVWLWTIIARTRMK